ncbi:membrane protein [Devosia pacifica]|uniref:Membrane protein n=1 Tax=Devosia pacifica TaxID=1335967 RepID=A0A918VN21_9HYPH|nr:hypothetical protein [Devosia pacifica]GHA14295.1 membrane protein [Devosia pacifica]
MTSFTRMRAGFAPRTRAFLYLTIRRKRYDAALAELPRFTGPTIVVGSAPNPTRPTGLDQSWGVVTVNASQITANDFGLGTPDLTVMRDAIMREDEHPQVVWAALAAKTTRHLVATIASPWDHGIEDYAKARGYLPDTVTELDRHIRGAVVVEMSGEYVVTVSSGISNGILAMLLALKLGAKPVVMAGFSVTPGWYFAPDRKGPRSHVSADLRVCRAVARRGLPVFASDAIFAEHSGLPLWTGRVATVAS